MPHGLYFIPAYDFLRWGPPNFLLYSIQPTGCKRSGLTPQFPTLTADLARFRGAPLGGEP